MVVTETGIPAGGDTAVLVAEDDEGLNRLICQALERTGIVALGVMSGREALTRLEAGPVSLLLLDYVLPDMKGSAVVESLRARSAQVPFIVMTGHGDQQVAVDMMKRGAHDYLVKDRDFLDALPRAVCRALDQLDIARRLREAEERQRSLEDQLRQAQKMEAIGVLAGGVAHDFNNLLTAIHGYTGLALCEVDRESKLYGQLEIVQRCAERAATLTRQLLLFSRKESAQLSPVRINDTVAEMINMLQRLIGEDITVVADLAPDLQIVNADAGNLEQILMNLAVNARDAMPEGGTLSIETSNVSLSEADCRAMAGSKPGAHVCLQVRDTGTGMDGETQKRIFEPFFTTKSAGKGTGLGLAVVYGIVGQHGGWIRVESHIGADTLFRVYLPAVDDVAAGAETDDTAIAHLQGRGEGILVVEDDATMREWCVIALGENGYRVFEAHDAAHGEAAFEANAGEISLVISDVIMPDKSGFALVEELRASKHDLKIILSSGYTGERSGWERVSALGYRFLQKPFTIVDLLRLVRGSLDERGSA